MFSFRHKTLSFFFVSDSFVDLKTVKNHLNQILSKIYDVMAEGEGKERGDSEWVN